MALCEVIFMRLTKKIIIIIIWQCLFYDLALWIRHSDIARCFGFPTYVELCNNFNKRKLINCWRQIVLSYWQHRPCIRVDTGNYLYRRNTASTVVKIQLSFSFLISCLENVTFVFFIFQQLSSKLIDNCTSGSARSSCLEISLENITEHSNTDNCVKKLYRVLTSGDSWSYIKLMLSIWFRYFFRKAIHFDNFLFKIVLNWIDNR